MGILDRMERVARAVGNTVQAPFGLAWDVARAPFNDDEAESFVGELFAITTNRGGDFLENLLGAEGVTGTVIGGLPEGFRDSTSAIAEGAIVGAGGGAAVGSVVPGAGTLAGAIGGAIGGGLYGGLTGRSAFEDSETAYREGIAEPISTAITVGSLSDTPRGGGVNGLFRPEKWREAYRIAQTRSPGQALAIAAGTRDIRDQAELNRFMGTDAYEIISGTTDAVLRLGVDPTVIGGRALGAARAGVVGRLASADDITRALNSTRVSRFAEDVAEIVDTDRLTASARIRGKYFSSHAQGDVVAAVLADAAASQGVLGARLAAGALMGDSASYGALRAADAPAAAKVDRLLAERSTLTEYQSGSLFSNEDRLAVVDDELRALYPEEARLARLDAAVAEGAAIRDIPRAPYWSLGPVNVPSATTIRTGITRSDFYQSSSLAAPLRVTTGMLPQRWLDLHDPTGSVQVDRALRQSKMPVDLQDTYRSLFIDAADPGARRVTLFRIENAIIRQYAERAGLSTAEFRRVAEAAKTGRRQADDVLASRTYDGKNRSSATFVDDDGTTHKVNLPAFVTQESNLYTFPDYSRLDDLTTRIGRFKSRHPSTAVPEELLTSAMRIWRPSVLLRVGWPVRVVGDEMLRSVAKIGALATLGGVVRGAEQYVADVGRFAPRALDVTASKVAKGSGVRAALREGRAYFDTQRTGIGERASTYRGYNVAPAFGTPGDAANAYRGLNSSNSSFRALIAADEEGILAGLRKRAGEWQTKQPGDVGYDADWVHAVNFQFGADPIGSRLLRGETVDQVTDFLTSTTEGRALAGRFSFRAGQDPREWVTLMDEIITDYTLSDPVIRSKALAGTATIEDLQRITPDASMRPLVHGEILTQLGGGGVVKDALGKALEGAFDTLGRMPSDVLVRNNFFDNVYRAEVRRLIDIADGQAKGEFRSLTAKDLTGIQSKARTYALRESKDLLYSLAERSELAEMTRFLTPFFSAFQEVTTRWAGLAIENPAFIARARLVWNSPEKAGVVTDENGNLVDEYGNARTRLTGESVEAGVERFINMQVAPDAVRSLLAAIPGAERLKDARFNKEAANLALQGTPGFGPTVQIPVNEIVKARPSLEASVRFILPFGTTQGIVDQLLPATAKRLEALNEGEENRIFANAVVLNYKEQEVRHNLGESTEKASYERALAETKDVYQLRTFASFASPVAIGIQSPYQPYIDAYRAAQRRFFDDPTGRALADEQGNARTVDQWFIDSFGEEYFALTGSLSKSMDGVQPTLEGFEARKKYQSLIEEYPELGGLIVGSEGAGEFSGAVYDHQLANGLKPGSSTKQRETPDFEQAAVRDPDIRAGWLQYQRFMDLIDAERIDRGLPNLRVTAAQDLADIKSAVTAKLAEQHPFWFESFAVTDRNSWAKRINAMRAISAEFEGRTDRQDMAGLAQYLTLRDAFTAELATRKAKTLAATSNQDLAELWDSATAALAERNLAFSSLYFRWLERDPLTPVAPRAGAATPELDPELATAGD